jgi:ADP-heptose:LPS heptosyltransferase
MGDLLYISNGGIGDVVMCLPALSALHRKTTMRIDTVVENGAGRNFLMKLPFIDRVDVCPLWSLRTVKRILRLGIKLRQRRYRIGIYGGASRCPKSVLLMHIADPKRISPTGNFQSWQSCGDQPMHKVDICFTNLAELGVEAPKPGMAYPVFPLDDEIRQRAGEVLKEWGLPGGKKLVALVNGSGNNPYAIGKLWDIKKLSEVALHLNSGNMAPIFFAGPNEMEQVHSLRQLTGGRIFVAEQMDLLLYAALLERCSAAVCNDTGLMHIAWAVGTPVIGLYGPTVPEITGAYGVEHISLRRCRRPFGCYRGGQKLLADCTAHSCMNQITAQDVISKLEAILSMDDAQ